MRIVGIDPGITGAVAFLGKRGAAVWDTPVLKVKVGKGPSQYDALSMVELLQKIRPELVVLERQQAMPILGAEECPTCHRRPNQGVSSTFKTGYGYGLWLGILIGLKLPHLVVSPQTWQKEMYQGAVGAGKERSVYVAQQLFPGVKVPRSKTGRADALLLAEYGRRSR